MRKNNSPVLLCQIQIIEILFFLLADSKLLYYFLNILILNLSSTQWRSQRPARQGSCPGSDHPYFTIRHHHRFKIRQPITPKPTPRSGRKRSIPSYSTYEHQKRSQLKSKPQKRSSGVCLSTTKGFWVRRLLLTLRNAVGRETRFTTLSQLHWQVNFLKNNFQFHY